MYALDENVIEVELIAAGYNVKHKLRRPTKNELVERDSRIKASEVEVAKDQVESHYSEHLANARLWDAIAVQVFGYEVEAGNADWLPVDDAVRAAMPSEHKRKAIAGMYKMQVEIVASSNGAGFKLMGSTEIRLKQIMGDPDEPYSELTHVLRRPSEAEWHAYDRDVIRVLQVRGARKPEVISQPNLQAAINLYDALLSRIEGATLGGEQFTIDRRDDFLASLDPLFKRFVIRKFADYWSADQKN
jgi:hypothetical protein